MCEIRYFFGLCKTNEYGLDNVRCFLKQNHMNMYPTHSFQAISYIRGWYNYRSTSQTKKIFKTSSNLNRHVLSYFLFLEYDV